MTERVSEKQSLEELFKGIGWINPSIISTAKMVFIKWLEQEQIKKPMSAYAHRKNAIIEVFLEKLKIDCS